MPAVRAHAGAIGALVLLWFIGTAIVSVWYVFSDPFFDYRLLLVGALLPDLIDVPPASPTASPLRSGYSRR